MRDIFLERVGNNGEEQIQDSRTHPDILRNILYSGVWSKYEYLQLKKKKLEEKQKKHHTVEMEKK